MSNNDKTKKAGITAKTFSPNFLSPAFVPQFFYPKFLFTPPTYSKRAEGLMRVGMIKVTWNMAEGLPNGGGKDMGGGGGECEGLKEKNDTRNANFC